MKTIWDIIDDYGLGDLVEEHFIEKQKVRQAIRNFRRVSKDGLFYMDELAEPQKEAVSKVWDDYIERLKKQLNLQEETKA